MAHPYQPAGYVAGQTRRAQYHAEQAQLQKYPVRAGRVSEATPAWGFAQDRAYPHVRS